MANLICTYNVTSTTEPTKICQTTNTINNGIEQIIIEGITHTVSNINSFTGYTFSNLGLNEVVFVLANNVGTLPYIFSSLTTLYSIEIPYSITRINSGAFNYCSNLTSVTLGANLRYIGPYTLVGNTIAGNLNVFQSCYNLQTINVNENNPYFVSTNNCLIESSNGLKPNNLVVGYGSSVIPDFVTSIGGGAFQGNLTITSIIIPESVTQIGEQAFGGCTSLTSVTIPESVTQIGNYAFFSCSSLNEIITKRKTPVSLSTYTFQGIKRGGTLYYPAGSDYSNWLRTNANYLGYYGWNGVEIDVDNPPTPDEPEEPTYNGGRIFVTYKPMLLDGVYKIDIDDEFRTSKFSRALYNGTELTKSDLSLGFLTVPDENDVVIEYQFDDGVIPDNAMQYSSCIKLEFGQGITDVGWNAFVSCRNLLEIILPDYEVNWELPNSDELYGWTFASCSSLINVVFPENVYDYSEGMFQFCTNLVSIDGTKIKEIKPHMFDFCTSLKTFVVSDTSEGIGVSAFNNCTSLSSISIGSGVTHIDGFAFSECTSLEEITLPSKIKIIMRLAFQDCTSLKTIHAENTTKLWLPYLPVFTNVVTGGTLYYPAGADYSQLLSNQEGTLGYYGWNGVEVGGEPEPIPNGEILTPNQTKTIVTSGETFQYTIETTNINYLTSYYISFGGDRYLDTIDGFISIEMVNMNNFNITVEENEGDERNCNIIFQYMDYNGKQLTHSLRIVQDAKPEEEPDEPEVTTPYVTGTTTILYFNYDGTPKTSKEFDVYWYGDYYDRNIANDSSHFGVSGKKIETTDDYVKYHYTVNCPQNTTSEVITGSCYFNIKLDASTYGESFVVEFIQDAKPEEEPDVPPTPDEPTYIEPEIRLYKTRLDYTSDGGDKYVQIDYYGATTILEPTCTQSWVTIQKTQGGWYEEEGVRVDQHQYRITMQPSSFARNTNVTFSCTDVNGKVFKDRHLMLYQSAAPAEPSVVVSKNQVNLDNVGEEDTIQVTYVNVNKITPPEVADGFTIEEISREELSGGRIQVTYKITRTSPKRQNAQINFSGTGSNGSTATSGNVTIKGEAVPAEFLVKIWPYEGDVLIVGEPNNDCLLDLYVYGYTGQYNFSYKINGDSSAIFVKNEEVWDSEDEAAHVYFTLELDAFPNNTNNSFIGTIDLTYTDEINNYNTSVPFKVRHANEGRIEAGSIKYEYDKDGNSTYTLNGGDFHIFYTNIETINEPAIDGDWIGVGEKVGNADRTDYHYAITIQPNSGAARKGYVTFSGKGIDGKNYSLEIEVKQEGTDTVKPIDEGYIELQQLSVELMADGGAQTFQVKYYDAKTIYEPELEFDWATITEVARTEPVPDTAWNGEECESLIITYSVTAEPTESGRQMGVKFKSDINYYDGGVVHMEKDKFIIYQLAEGSTEVQGDIALLRYSKDYTYYGSPKGFNPEVGYTDLAPSAPIFSETWCRVKSYTDTTARDYDFIRRYELEVDKNESNLSRRCTITFVGEAQDGTKATAEITITQEGQEEIINEGEYSNYKGYFRDFEGALHSIAFITNPRSDVFGDIRLAGDSPVVVSYSTNSELYEPLRTSTCTVKVLTSSYLMNLYTGKAKGTQVILRNEDTGKVEWCGFLQPNLYNQGFTECIEEVEFEASDCLQTLQYLKYEYLYQGNGQPMIVNYKEIIDYILDECELISAYNITQKMFTDSKTNRIIDFKNFYMSENNFYSEEGEPWTLQEVMEETCKFFGFVCFQWGDEIYFMDFDKFQSNKQMYGLKYTKDSWSWQGPVDIYISDKPNEVTERSYRGSGADISLDDIFNKVTVNCNYYNIDELIPDLFEDDFLEERNTISITSLVNRGQEIGRKTDFIVYDHKNINSIFYKPIIATSNHQIQATPTEEDFKNRDFFKTYVGGNIVDMVSLNYSELNRDKAGEPKDWERYLMISQLNRPWCAGFAVGGTSQAWETYNFPIMEFHNLPQIFIDNTEEAFEDNSSSSTGGRVPSTGGRVPSTRVGFGSSSSTSRNDRETSTVRVNKGKHYLVIDAEAAFVDRFDMPYIPDEAAGFGKKSNYDFNGYSYDQIRGNGNKTNVTPTLTFYLEIPQAGWWDGKKWVNNETWFEVPLEEADYLKDIFYSFKGAQNTVATNLFLGKTGYKIELPQTMESTAFMQFKIGMPKRFAHVLNSQGGDDTGQAGNAYCFIKDLKMNIVSKNTSMMENEDMVYENIIDDNNVVDGPEIDLKITSDNYICYSLSTVSTKYEADDKPTTNFRFFDMENNPVKPEECIIERYVNQYSTPSLKENLTLDMSFLPTQLITDTYWEKDFVIIGQEIDYQMCRQDVTLLEKK